MQLLTLLAAGLTVLLVGVLAWRKATRPATLAAGAFRVGPYWVERKLGEGGMGTVFEGRHDTLGRRTAIKVIRPNVRDRDHEARFDREARLTSELSHPNTVAFYDYGRTDEGLRYYAMELVEGMTLSQLLKLEGPLPASRALNILRQVAASLAHAHAKGLVHRDIKPENIMLSHREGHPDWVKVLDFGLAKRLEGELILSSAGMQIGTPEFMAPEMIEGPLAVGPATDVYAVGVLAYCLLTGETPFQGRNLGEVLNAHRFEAPIPPSLKRMAELPLDLERVVMNCLKKAPRDRYCDGFALLKALDACHCAPGAEQWSDEDAERWWLRSLRAAAPSKGEGGANCDARQRVTTPLREERRREGGVSSSCLS